MAKWANADEWYEERSTAEYEPDPSITATYLFDLQDKQYTLDVVKGVTSWSKGRTKEPTCTISAKEADFLKMASGELSAQRAMLTRKVKISPMSAVQQALALQKYAG